MCSIFHVFEKDGETRNSRHFMRTHAHLATPSRNPFFYFDLPFIWPGLTAARLFSFPVRLLTVKRSGGG